jgi:Fe-S oxidoreductase
MGLIHHWSRLAALAPEVANFVSQTPILRDVAKWIGGIAPEREVPAFAPETFKAWWRRRGPRNLGRPQAILWADTFNNHFHPEVAKAAVEVLEAAGYQVQVPMAHVCCGRPLYDFGMLDQAEALLHNVLHELRPQIEAGVPVIGLEPSCLAVFRDELPNLLPGDADARLLAGGSFTLAELLAGHAGGWRPPPIGGRAIVQGHCHQQAVIGMEPDLALLRAAGVDAELLDAGCCGMAGAFGFEADHYQVAMAVGERRLLPAVRTADQDTLVLADGFSCHTQIEQATGRHPLHLAEALAAALGSGLSRTG